MELNFITNGGRSCYPLSEKCHIFICGSYFPYLGIYVIVCQADEA